MNISHRSITRFLLVALCAAFSMVTGVTQSTHSVQAAPPPPDCSSPSTCTRVGIFNSTSITRNVSLTICCGAFPYSSIPISVPPFATIFWNAPAGCRIVGVSGVTPIPPTGVDFIWSSGTGCRVRVY